MVLKKKSTEEHLPNNRAWKEKNKRYLNELQKFLDITDSIQNESLRKDIIHQMLKCDLVLTELAEKEMKKQKEKMYNENQN